MADRRVLVIEDDAAVRLALEVFLTAEEGVAEVATAPDGDTGVHTARSLRPDVIVTDSTMPGMSGEELGRALRTSCPEATIISFSGLMRDAAWADHRIQKGGPDTFDELARAVSGAPVVAETPLKTTTREELHDLRNLLTPVTGYASLLQGGAENMPPGQVRELAERILESVDRVNRMLDSL